MMKKKAFAMSLLLLGILLVPMFGLADDSETLKREIISNGSVSFKNNRKATIDSDSVQFSGDIMIWTKKIDFKDGVTGTLVAEIPLNSIDTTRFDSTHHIEAENVYCVTIYTKNDAKTIKITRYINGKPDGEPFYTYSHMLYTIGETGKNKLIDNFKKLVPISAR